MFSRYLVPILGLLLLCASTRGQDSKLNMLYKDPNQRMNICIKVLMDQTTLEEKIGQMAQIDRRAATPEIMRDYSIGNLLSGGGVCHVNRPQPRSRWIEKDLVKRIGAATALEARATGIPYVFTPCITVCRDPRWGRCYESYSEDPKIVQDMTEIIPGLQGNIPPNSPKGVLMLVETCAKHYVGDDGTTKGINMNNKVTNWHGLLSIHMPPYYNSIIKGVSTVMVSYSSLNEVKMHANRQLVTKFLKGTLRFRVMVPLNHTEFIDTLTSLVNNNFIPAGLMMLSEDIESSQRFGKEAVRKSLVLLKNGENADSPVLPLPNKASKILVAGSHANKLGFQCGVHPSTETSYSESPDEDFVKSNNFSYAVVVVGEPPYAESAGDNSNLTIPQQGLDTIKNVCGNVKCVVVLVSGRPLVIQPHLEHIDALVAAWLPGTEGNGVADVRFGDYGFNDKSSRTWFKTVDQLPMNVDDSHYDPLFPVGYGLTT
ncbi:unnamed protein product [Fraxinus pennsylvanica]|uniref:Uncharacterized protein n=1 Tax=Fraxinus pennsylvanica TaxID=56036 RepID=A0AAD2A484_9LAMI|nr:unnamed protein product [Fraxinus pennsylvanica]